MHPEWWAKRAKIERPGRPHPLLVRLLQLIGRPVVRLCHRPTLDGIENLPREGPYLLIANHSAGTAVAEILSFAVLYLDRVGADRPLAAFAHPAAFSLWPVSLFLRHVGAVPSSVSSAEKVLAEGVPLLVFPGGDREAFRPIWQAHRVDFGGRKGFLRLARAARVPVVPMGIRGSAFTAPILFRAGAWLPALLILPWLGGVKRYPITALGILVSAAILALAPLALPFQILLIYAFHATLVLPTAAWIPATIRMRIGAPLAPEALFPERDAPDAELAAALARVEGEVQRLVDGQAARGSPT